MALSKAQAETEPAPKNAFNPHFKSKYADLESVWITGKGPMTKYGLSISQGLRILDGQWICTTKLMHVSGEWIESDYPIILDQRAGPQPFKGSCTYARRGSIEMILGIATEDDDAEIAQKTISEQQNKNTQKALPPQLRNEPEIDVGETVFPKGKFEGLRIKDVPSSELPGYIKYLRNKEIEMKKKIEEPMLSAVQAAEIFLSGMN